MRPKRDLCLWYVWRKPCTYLGLTLTPSPNGVNEIPHDPCHLGVPSGVSKLISNPVLRLAQTVNLSWVKISTISKRTKNEHPLEPRHLGEPSGASKMIYQPMVRLAQTMHLS